jgi:DNA-binding CsgD family transcriptional regulator
VNEVAACSVVALSEVARRRALPVEAIFREAGIDLAAVRAREVRRVDWARYAAAIEGFVAACGGPDAAAAVTTDLHLSTGSMDWIVSSRFAPADVYRSACQLAPRAWRNLKADLAVTGDGRLRIEAKIPPSDAGSSAFFQLSRASIVSLPTRAGLPPAEVALEALSPHGAVYVVRAATPFARAAAPPALPPDTRRDLVARAEAAASAWGLTATEGLVLREVLGGLTNKEVGAELGMAEATVEVHMTHIFRKARIQGRTTLISRVWTTDW